MKKIVDAIESSDKAEESADTLKNLEKSVYAYNNELNEKKQKLYDFMIPKSKGRIHADDFDEELAEEIISFCTNGVAELNALVDEAIAYMDEHGGEVVSIESKVSLIVLSSNIMATYMTINTADCLVKYVTANKNNIKLTRTQTNFTKESK